MYNNIVDIYLLSWIIFETTIWPRFWFLYHSFEGIKYRYLTLGSNNMKIWIVVNCFLRLRIIHWGTYFTRFIIFFISRYEKGLLEIRKILHNTWRPRDYLRVQLNCVWQIFYSFEFTLKATQSAAFNKQ